MALFPLIELERQSWMVKEPFVCVRNAESHQGAPMSGIDSAVSIHMLMPLH
jgi:hypothetical protein